MLELAAEMETGSAKDYNDWANECSKNADVPVAGFRTLDGD